VRVLTRWDRLSGDPRRPPLQGALWERARALANGPTPGALNQALMELGATVCTPRSPSCLLCPVAEGCAARAAGDPERYPRKAERPERPVERFVAALVETDEGIWLVRRPETGLLAGLWELPMVDAGEPGGLAALGLEPLTREGTGRTIVHAFTHRVWHVEVVRATGRPDAVRWPAARQVPGDALADAGLTGPALKALHAWRVDGAPRRRGAGRLR
jgi:A/G-specific adenine glycosylase